MESASDCVERLATLVGMAERAGEQYDWPAIESSLGGLSLPRDYKAFVEMFPRGRINEQVMVIRPGDVNSPRTEYLGYYAHPLDDMREVRAGGHLDYPYPIFPEPSGMLPWGEGADDEMYFWLTDAGDPDAWPVVWTDRTKEEWHHFPGTMCEFLIGVVSGQVFAGNVPPVAPAGEFRTRRWGIKKPANEFAELSDVIGTHCPEAATPDWAGLERDVGVPLPSDYRDFINRYGVGVFCDIRIVGPDPCAEFDLLALLRRQIEQVQSSPRARLAFSAANNGAVLAWGETPDGWVYGWSAAADPDPETWGVAVLSPNFIRLNYDELSFSTFLLHYSGHRDQLGVTFARDPWSGGPTFHQHRHS